MEPTKKKPAKKPTKKPTARGSVTSKRLSDLPVLWSVEASGQAIGFYLGEEEVWAGWEDGDVLACNLEGTILRRWMLPKGVDALVGDESWRYAGCRDGKIYDLTSERPQEAYVDPSAHIQSIDIFRGMLCASDSHGTCTVVDVKQHPMWSRPQKGGTSAWMVRAEASGVYLGSSTGVTRFDWEGQRQWHSPSPWVGFGVLTEDRVYVFVDAWSRAPALLALRKDNGEVVFKGLCKSRTKAWAKGANAAACAASSDGKRVFAAVRDTLFCFDATGQLSWELTLPCGTPCSMGFSKDRLYVATHRGRLACLDVSEAAVTRARAGAVVVHAESRKVEAMAETSRELQETHSADGGVVVECVQVGTELRVRVSSPGFHPEWFVQFPRNLREPGARFVVEQVREATQGGFYRTLGAIRRLKSTPDDTEKV